MFEKIKNNLRKRKEESAAAKKTEEDLDAKMSRIELFPGSLTEYNNFKKAEYEIIDVSGNKKFFRGAFGYFGHLEGDSEYGKEYREIVRKAAELNADAIIRYYIINNMSRAYSEMGIPVKKKTV